MSEQARAEVNGTLPSEEQSSRVAAYSFNPDAPPQEKAAAAGKGAEQLKSVQDQPGAGETDLPLVTGKAVPPPVPTILIEDHDSAQQSPVDTKDTSPPSPEISSDPSVPGSIPDGLAPEIPDWYRIGWRAVGGIDKEPLVEGEETEKSVLTMFLSEQYYGSWYHNAALIVFAVFASHFLTRFGFGWGWLFIVLAFCCTYYSTSMERVRRRARDDIQRELVKTRLLSEHESADWMNNFLDRFWLIYEPVLSRTIISSVDQVLSASTPAFLESLRLTEFTLGTKAPRIDKVRTFPKTPDDIVTMDWGISFTPNDVSDITPRQAANKVNPKIVLSVRVGKGVATAALPILVEDITFAGLMRIKMKLMTSFPHVQVVDISFLEKPVIDFVLKPIGGETFGFDIANIPGLFSFIRDTTHSILGPMMYDPNVFTLNLEQLLSGTPLDTACGVLQVTVHSARGIQGVKIGGGTPDPYVGLSIENRTELARTKYKNNTYNPTWSETKFLLVNNLSETLMLNVWDYNDHRKNTLLGSATFELPLLLEDATREDIVSKILKDGKDRGELRYDVSFFPVIEAEQGSEEADTSVGIVRLTVHQAKDLDQAKSTSGDLNPFAKVFTNGKTLIHTTPKFKHTNNPVWESHKEFLCSDRKNTTITIKVIDDRDFLKDPVVGYMGISLEHLLEAKKESKDWFSLSGCNSGKIRVSAEWKPLNMAGSLHGADQYQPPIGVVRLDIQKATDVKNVEATLGGKSDPYVRVQVNNVTKGRTEVINNNLNPVWNQIVYVPVHSLKEHVFLECMDYQHLTKDRSLGSVDLAVSDLAEEDKANNEYPYKSTGVKEISDPLRLDKGQGFKGQLHYTAQFVPALAIRGVKFEGTNQLKETLKAAPDSDGGYVSDSNVSSMSSSDEEAQAVPEGVTISHISKHKHKKNTLSSDTTKTSATVLTTASSSPDETPSSPVEMGVELNKDALLERQSGIIVFNIISGQLLKKARLEVLLDDAYWPAFTTVEARSTHAQWQYIGEGFIKELDFGRVWLRLNEADEDEKDDIIAEWKGNAKEFLESTLDRPTTFNLSHGDSQQKTSTIVVEARYVPVPVQLEPRESVNNQGTLRVELLDGRDIHGVDRSGKSDPFVVFTLNGQKVYKSQTKKKTLSPDWQESFVVQVPSRVGADFSMEVFDWNQIEQAKSLGSAKIELADIEPFLAQERTLQLSSSKHGDKGEVRIRMVFQPEIIAKSRKNTSTFSAAGRAMTQIGGLPVGAGKGVFHGVAGALKKVRGGGDDSSSDEEDVPNITGQVSQPVGNVDAPGHPTAQFAPTSQARPSVDAGSTNEIGTLKVTVSEASGLSSNDWKPYAIVRLGDKEHKTKHVGKTATPEWNETFKFAASAMTPKMFIWIHDHKTIGKDKLLGTAEIEIWRHVQAVKGSAADVTAELKDGSGLLRLRLEYDPDTQFLSTSNSSIISDRDREKGRSISLASPSRFSISRRRGGEDD